MPDYRRNRVPGGSYFFTVNLLERHSRLLVEHIDTLREAVRQVRVMRPFYIDAWVVLPDHTHCVWTLPPDDANYSARWKAIKIAFAKKLPKNRKIIGGSGAQGRARYLAKALLGAYDPR